MFQCCNVPNVSHFIYNHHKCGTILGTFHIESRMLLVNLSHFLDEGSAGVLDHILLDDPSLNTPFV